MILENKYQLYKSKRKQDFTLRIQKGLVDFERNVVVTQSENVKIETTIQRTDNKDRQRADANQRHGSNVLAEFDSNMNLVDLRDFEWLAWNYRTFKMQTNFKSKQDMVLMMFD